MCLIKTFTGRLVNPLNLKPEDVDVRDIAHALAMKCRFNGHTRDFYSVAQHSVIVSQHVPGHLTVAALLHDAGEAYIPDMPTPIKQSALCPGFEDVEFQIQRAVARHFGFDQDLFNAQDIHTADKRAVETEASQLMVNHTRQYDDRYPPFDYQIEPCSPRNAEHLFLYRFYQLRG